LALGVLRAATVDCAAAGDAVDGGRTAADAPHAATAQATASALAARNVCLIMLLSMRRPASGLSLRFAHWRVTFEAIGGNEKDMKLARPGRPRTSTALSSAGSGNFAWTRQVREAGIQS